MRFIYYEKKILYYISACVCAPGRIDDRHPAVFVFRPCIVPVHMTYIPIPNTILFEHDIICPVMPTIYRCRYTFKVGILRGRNRLIVVLIIIIRFVNRS